jgi:predicted nucleic acid-binding Zn ribbon protein
VGRRGPPRTLEPRLAKDAIGAALAFHGITDRVRAERVLAEWSELVGPKIASRTRPHGVDGRTLVIEVATSAWLHELNLLRSPILAGLVERVGEPRVFDQLVFRLAGRSRSSARPEPPRALGTRARVTMTPLPATGAAREQIVLEVAKVEDEELRDLIARVRIQNDR